MAKRTWIGGATAVAQVDHATVSGTIEIGDLFIVTLTDESGATQTISVAATSTAIATTCNDITTAWNASTQSQFAKITATTGATFVTLTAKTAGVPFYLSCTTTEAGGGASDSQVFLQSAFTPNSGPNDYICPANWQENAVPVATNDVLLTGSNAIYYGMRQSGVSIGKFSLDVNFRGNIGVPGAALSITPTAFLCDGGGTMYINLNAAAIAPTVTGATRLTLNGSALTTVTVAGGTVAMGIDPSDTPTLTSLSLQPNGTAIVGAGATITTFKQAGGTGFLYAAATTVEAQAGILTIAGVGAITTLTNSGATVNSNASGTIGTLNANAGTTDLTQSRIARAITTLNHQKGATVKLDTAVVAVTTYTPAGLMTLAAS